MNHRLIVIALALSLGAPGVAIADAPVAATPFNDDACPQANDSGRKLNALNAAGNVSGDDLMAAAQGLVDAYKDCRDAFDRLVNSKNADHQSDYIPVHRIYARLQLARSYQRIGSFDEQLHAPEKARVQYDLALDPLSQIADIMEGARVGLADRGSAEFRLKSEADTLRDQIVATEKKLPPVAAASPEAK